MVEIDYTKINQDMYDRYAKEFEDNTKDYLKNHILKDANLFIENLPGKDILDLGSGPGRDSSFFKERGLNPLCVDISPKMVRLCKEKGLPAQIGDLENLQFDEGSFDGIWAYTSLLHIPKANLSKVLGSIRNILRPRGMIYIGMKEGEFEGWKKSEKYLGMRFFSLYRDSELIPIIGHYFNIIHTSRVILGDAIFLNYLGRRIKT